MKTERQKLEHEFNIFKLGLERIGKEITIDDYIRKKEKKSILIKALNELMKEDSLYISRLLYTSSDENFFVNVDKNEDIKKLESIICWLDKNLQDRKTSLRVNAVATIAKERGAAEAVAKFRSIKEYKVVEFADIVKRHPNTIRSDYKKGKIEGRQDSKGIWIDASALACYGITNDQ